jgi:CRP/FNR family cyclic AMP-dependent transcriptional regulator
MACPPHLAVKASRKPTPENIIFDATLFLESNGLGRKIVTFRRKETIFAQGSPAQNVMYIQEGTVQLTVLNTAGNEAGVDILGSGDFLGTECLSGRSVNTVAATAIAPSSLLVIEKAEMIRVLHAEHAMSDRFIQNMLARNRRGEDALTDQLFNSSEKRLARTLLLLARYGKNDQPRKAFPKVSQQMLAEMVGTTRSRINYFMNKFRKLGFIKYNGEIHVNPSLLSVVLHD